MPKPEDAASKAKAGAPGAVSTRQEAQELKESIAEKEAEAKEKELNAPTDELEARD